MKTKLAKVSTGFDPPHGIGTLDIDILRTFHAVAQLGQFRAAAERVHRSPAAVSVHIQRLEALAGGRVLERDNQSVSLTPLGRRVLAGTGDMLRLHDRMLAELQGTRLAGRVKLGVPDEYATHVIHDILPGFNQEWPEVVLEVTTATSRVLRDQIERKRLHVAITVLPASEGPHGVALALTQPVWVSGAHAPTDLPVPVPLALHAASCPYRDAMLDALDRAGLTWRVVLSSPSGRAVEACVEAGLAIGLIDRSRVSPAMRVLDELPAVPVHRVVALMSESAATDPAATQLTRAITQHFRL